MLIRLDPIIGERTAEADGPTTRTVTLCEKRSRPMTCAQAISALALRRLLLPHAPGTPLASLGQLYADPGPHVARALRQANARAWFGIELVLAGESLRECLNRPGARAEGLEQPILTLLDAAGPAVAKLPAGAVATLQQATESGILTSGVIDAAEALRAAGGEGAAPFSETEALERLADQLDAENHQGLRPFLQLRTVAGAPLVVCLVAALFRLAVESNPDLFCDLPPLPAGDLGGSNRGDFHDVASVLTRDGARLEALLEEARRIGRSGVLPPADPEPPAPQPPAQPQLPPPESDDARERLRRGEDFVRRGEYDFAVSEFTAALRADPSLTDAYARRGDALRLRGECEPALADLTRAVELAPGDPRARVSRGLTLALSGRHAEAIEDFTAALEFEPSAVAYNQRGSSRAAVGDLEGALADFTEAMRLDPESPWAAYNRGDTYLAKREYLAAVADLSTALRLNPQFALSHARRGDAYRLNGELDRAIADYTNALRLDPHNVAAYVNRGTAYRKKGLYEPALADFSLAVQLDPANPELYLQRGLAYRLKDEPARALADLDTAARLSDENAEVYYQRGLTNEALGRRSAALADLTRVVQLAPDHSAAFNSRGTIRADLGDVEGAEADFSEALRLNPDFTLALLNRASARSKARQFESAIADCDAAIRLDPGLANAYLMRGSARAQIDQLAPAMEDFSEVLRRDARNDRALYLRGVARSKQGDHSGAIADLSESIQIDPSQARAYAFRGLSYQALKQQESALDDFARAVRFDGRYAAAYCNQRAALHAARGEHEQAAADYSLVLLFDPGNEVAKSGREQALRALLARPAPRPAVTTGVQPAPEPTPRTPSRAAEAQSPRALPAASARRAVAAGRPRPKTRPGAPKTEVLPKAPPTEALPAVVDSKAEGKGGEEVAESSAEFELGPRYNSPGENGSSVELEIVSEDEAAEEAAPVDQGAGASDSAESLLNLQADSQEEMARQEQLANQRREQEARAEEAARLQRLAAERQRMLEEVKRKKSEIDRARREKKRKVRTEDDEDAFPWTQWAMRAALAVLVLWGCWWVYDTFWAPYGSQPSCYPVHGTVKLADGRPISGGTLTFSPTFDGPTNETDLGREGTFETRTFSNKGADGIPPGEYKAFLTVPAAYKELVPAKYLSREQSPWLVKVKKQDNAVDLVVE